MIRPATAEDHGRLIEIWRDAVAATHDFLDGAAIDALEADVRQWLATAPEVLVSTDGQGVRGFIGMDGAAVEALFVDPGAHRQGHGRALLEAVADRAPLRLDVNEANPAAAAYYERMGFVRTGRSPRDSAGRPYPVLHMRGPAPI
jgi:putative acetyltransferase